MNDTDIVRRVQAGDSECFSLLVEKYHTRLLNFIYRLVRDRRMVEDIGQEVFLNVYKSIRNFDISAGTPFSAWLFISARNACISELRKDHCRDIPIEEADEPVSRERSPEKAAMDKELLEAIRASLGQLREPYKSTVLQSLQGVSPDEIAVLEGISRGTVKSRLFRARARLKSMLREYFGGKDYERL